MPFITSFERIGIEQGLEQGRQEGRQEGIQKGLQAGQISLIVRMLKRRWGTLAPELEIRLSSLSVAQLESLGETLLDFRDPSDLQRWLDEAANRVN
jgi:predicted transposase YdaD